MELTEILVKHKLWLDGNEKGEYASLQGASLQYASLQYASLQRASLQRADLQRADLQGANLRGADLQGASLQGASLQGANLQGANLQGANLQYASLQRADLQYADLQGANIDFSCWPLWCGSKNVKVSNTIAQQLAAHFCVLDCDDKDYRKAKKAIMSFAKKSHRATDLGL